MDQFSHDLTLALEETSLMDRACGVGRWGSRRRTRSTGNLPCAPQPTEDSSSSPTDTLNLNALGNSITHKTANVDGLHAKDIKLPASDSDEKAEGMLPLRLPCGTLNAAVRMGLGALESDSLNETNFSPARFYKPCSRRKRKIKRMSMEFEFNKDNNFAMSPNSVIDFESQLQQVSAATQGQSQTGAAAGTSAVGFISATGTVRKRVLKSDPSNRSNLFFCGKRKRSNRDRYQEHDHGGASTKLQSSSMPRYTYMDEYQRIRPRSYSFTSKPHSERLLPLNKGLLSKINRIAAAQQQKTDTETSNKEVLPPILNTFMSSQKKSLAVDIVSASATSLGEPVRSTSLHTESLVPIAKGNALVTLKKQQQQVPLEVDYQLHRKKNHGSSTSKSHRRRGFCLIPYTATAVAQAQAFHSQQSMDCTELYDFLSSSSLSSSSDSEDGHQRHDTDREGDDELTDWPGNEFGLGGKYDPKRKLTKKSILPQIRSDDTIGEDDTLMSGTETMLTTETATAITPVTTDAALPQTLTFTSMHNLSRFQPAVSSEPIDISGGNTSDLGNVNGIINVKVCLDAENNVNTIPPPKQIESEMSGETSNPFLSSPQSQVAEVREIRAGCRRINGDRPGFSIKLSVNERLARFLQDPRQTQIRLPDIELYERDSLFNLATLYSLTMVVDHGSTVLTKTTNTTQSVSIEQHRGLQNCQDFLGDFKRRCYGDGDGANLLPRK